MSVVVSLQSKVCSKCGEVKLLEEFNKQKAKKDGRYPSCKTCVKEYNVQYDAANPEKRKELAAKRRAANPNYYAEWCAANPEKCRAKEAKRRAAKLLAIPSWLTEEDYKAMEAIYAEAKRLEAETGLIYHVDHIHPLQGKLVCGLHCPTNLQILTEAENCSKGNKFTPYVESDLTCQSTLD